MSKSIKHIISVVSSLAFLLLVYNSAANFHVHRQADGIFIKHSHPYNHSEDTKHNHNECQIFIIEKLCPVSLEFKCQKIDLPEIKILKSQIFFFKNIKVKLGFQGSDSILRAPPSRSFV